MFKGNVDYPGKKHPTSKNLLSAGYLQLNTRIDINNMSYMVKY